MKLSIDKQGNLFVSPMYKLEEIYRKDGCGRRYAQVPVILGRYCRISILPYIPDQTKEIKLRDRASDSSPGPGP